MRRNRVRTGVVVALAGLGSLGNRMLGTIAQEATPTTQEHPLFLRRTVRNGTVIRVIPRCDHRHSPNSSPKGSPSVEQRARTEVERPL